MLDPQKLRELAYVLYRFRNAVCEPDAEDLRYFAQQTGKKKKKDLVVVCLKASQEDVLRPRSSMSEALIQAERSICGT